MNLATPQGMADAVRWQEQMVARIKDGGCWVVPRSLSIIEIHASKKLAVFVTPSDVEPDIVKVFNTMGWTIASYCNP